MTDDLATQIRDYYESAAPPVDAHEAIERHAVRVGGGDAPRQSPMGWLRKHPAVAVGAAVVATFLVVGGVLLTVPADPDPFFPTVPVDRVAGESSCAIHEYATWSGTPLPGGFSDEMRGQINTCVVETSDARVNGWWDVAINCDYSVENGATAGQCWGTLEMVGDDGGWAGTWTGATEWSPETDEILHIVDADAIGSGEYAGLRYLHRLMGIDTWTVTGRIGPLDAFGPTTTDGP